MSTFLEHKPLLRVFLLSLGPSVAIGLARFAYGLLLPAMRTSLHLSYAQAGMLNAANALGYLAGALVAARISQSLGVKRLFMGSLLAISLALALSALTSYLDIQLGLRALTGFLGALAFISGAGLASQTASGRSARNTALLLGVYCAGGGIGMISSALIIPPLLLLLGWQGGWLGLGIIGLFASLLAGSALSGLPSLTARSIHPSFQQQDVPLPDMRAMITGYGLFGSGYIAYVTFIVAYLHRPEVGFHGSVTLFWALLGGCSVLSPFIWERILPRFTAGQGTALTIAGVATGALLPLLGHAQWLLYSSALLFGSSFLMTVSTATAFARASTPPQQWTKAIGLLTVSFGVGQCLGPIASGFLADRANGLQEGMELSVLILVLAAATVLRQRDLSPSCERNDSMNSLPQPQLMREQAT